MAEPKDVRIEAATGDEVPAFDEWMAGGWAATKAGGLTLGVGRHRFWVGPKKDGSGRFSACFGGHWLPRAFNSADDAKEALWRFASARGTLAAPPRAT